MRLSEAIALGRVLVKPVGGAIFDRNGGGCAIGMAIAAKGADPLAGYDCFDPLGDKWNWTRHFQVPYFLPCGCESRVDSGPDTNQAGSVIVHLFDYHVMCPERGVFTLDQLIDWIASVEPAEPAPAAAEQQVAEAREDSNVLT